MMKRLTPLLLIPILLVAFAKAQAQVMPSSGKKYPVGTRFIGKCQAPKTPPELKNEGFDDNGVPKGPVLHYHLRSSGRQ